MNNKYFIQAFNLFSILCYFTDKFYPPVLIPAASQAAGPQPSPANTACDACCQAALPPGQSLGTQPHGNQHQDKSLPSETEPRAPAQPARGQFTTPARHLSKVSGQSCSLLPSSQGSSSGDTSGTLASAPRRVSSLPRHGDAQP